MPKNMNDVNEMRLEAAAACGEATWLGRHVEDDEYGLAMREAGQLVQHAGDLEAWVTLRERIVALRTAANEAKRAATTIPDQVLFAGDVAAFEKVLKIMDELEGP